MLLYRLALFSLLFSALNSPVWAQDVTGTVQGAVTDASGARIASATVNLVNQGTQQTLTRTSSDSGDYYFNLVPPGQYTVSATASGFKTANAKNVEVAVNKSTRVDLALEVGSVQESVEVSAESVRIDTASAQVSTNINQKMIIDLPSSSRNALSYAEMAPGVNIVNGASQVQNITGTSANLFQAWAAFEDAWEEYLPLCNERVFTEHRRKRVWTAWKQRMWNAGCRMPTQNDDGRSHCFCGVEIDVIDLERHVYAAHMVLQ